MIRRMSQDMRRHSAAFTLIELMIVVVILSILVLAAVPLYRSNAKHARISEGIAGIGAIRTAFRLYAAANNGNYPVLTAVSGSELSVLNVGSTDLDGKFFDPDDYSVTSTASAYTITATDPGSGLKYEIDENGDETTGSGYYVSGY